MTIFETLIEELGKVLEIPLQAEKEVFCNINAGDIIQVQLEYKEGKVLMGSFLVELPPGTFREEVLVQGLKYNHDEKTRETFSFVPQKEMLVLGREFDENVSAKELADALKKFAEVGQNWKEAVDQGNLSSISKPATNSFVSPLNLKP